VLDAEKNTKVSAIADTKFLKKSKLFERDVVDSVDMPFIPDTRMKDIEIASKIVLTRPSPKTPVTENKKKIDIAQSKLLVKSRYSEEMLNNNK
jgi:hypothetical protein